MWAGVTVYPANVGGFFVGALVNVLLIRWFVFKDNRFSLLKDVGLTLVSNGAMLLVGMLLLWVLVELLNVGAYTAKLCSNAATFVLNYMIRVIFFRRE